MLEKWRGLSARKQLVWSLLGASLVSSSLWFFGAVSQNRFYEFYLNWNLFLAWLPLLFALLVLRTLKTKRWSSWEGIAWTFLWLGFLPNSFYMVSDFIHIRELPADFVLYGTVVFASFIFCGVALGCASLFLVHEQLRKRWSLRDTTLAIASVLLLCSFAIYLGRNLRWNTWDIILNPAGILFDVSDRVLYPAAHPQTYTITLSFFVLISMLYFLFVQVVGAFSRKDRIS